MFVSFSFLTSLVTKTGGSLNLMGKKATFQQITLERCHMLNKNKIKTINSFYLKEENMNIAFKLIA